MRFFILSIHREFILCVFTVHVKGKLRGGERVSFYEESVELIFWE